MEKLRKIIKLRKLIFGITILSVIIEVIIFTFFYVIPKVLSLKVGVDYSDVSSIGIIGAADGVTSIMVAVQSISTIFVAIPFIITIAGCLYLIFTRKIKDKDTSK